MPFHGLSGRNQKAAYWPCVGRDANGQPVVDLAASPITLDVRWDGTARTVLMSDGTPIAIDATAVVDRDIPLGSALWEGDVADLPAGQTPNQDVHEVILFDKTPDFKGRNFYREVKMIRKRDSV